MSPEPVGRRCARCRAQFAVFSDAAEIVCGTCRQAEFRALAVQNDRLRDRIRKLQERQAWMDRRAEALRMRVHRLRHVEPLPKWQFKHMPRVRATR